MDPQAIDAYVDELAKNYSGLAKAYDVGASHGRRMKALEVSSDAGRGSHMKPGIRIMAGFRGRESVGSQVCERKLHAWNHHMVFKASTALRLH